MRRPLQQIRPIGPFAQLTSNTCDVVLHVPDPSISYELDKKFSEDFNLTAAATSDNNETRVYFPEEQLISTMYFGITDVVGEPPRGTYVSGSSGNIALEIKDSYDSLRGSVMILDDFLGELEGEAEKRGEDVDTGSSRYIPSNSELRDILEEAIDDIASGMNSISSHRVYWTDEGYRARFIWEDNIMDLSLALDVIAEMANITEEFGGAGRDLQTVKGKAVCL